MAGLVHITNKAYREMGKYGLSEAVVMDAYNNGVVEWVKSGSVGKSIKYYNGYEVGVFYVLNENGDWIITAVWSRKTFY